MTRPPPSLDSHQSRTATHLWGAVSSSDLYRVPGGARRPPHSALGSGAASRVSLGLTLALLTLSLGVAVWTFLRLAATVVPAARPPATSDGAPAAAVERAPALAAPVALEAKAGAPQAAPHLAPPASQVMADPAAATASDRSAAPPAAPATETLAGAPAASLGGGSAGVRSQASPTQTVFGFYQAVARQQFDLAAQHWSPRMRATYPPPVYLVDRFARTRQITVRRADVLFLDEAAGRAPVAVEVAETSSFPAFNRTWHGSWRLVRTPGGWLLDQPNFGAG